jgi:uncharacterized membrane protein SpoIIM required for sporulation
MLETLLNPKKAERNSWELFFIGFFYAAVSLLMVNWLFAGNPIFSKHISILVITFTVMLSLPFMFYTIKLEEERDVFEESKFSILKGHGKAISAFMWLFVGFLLAFSAFYILFPSFVGSNFQAQIEQYCSINMPFKFNECVSNVMTANALSVGGGRILDILTNNLYVLLFCIIFSLVFGAGAIFILAWNATVIATAVGIFAKSSMTNMPSAVFRYMLHGLPEIAAYFTAALAGGIISVGLIRHDVRDPKFWAVMADSLNLILISIAILIIAALMEVFITPRFF